MSSTKKISRKLSAVEQKLHQASLAAPNKTITPEDLTKLAGDASTGTAAINFLLSVGMLKAQNDSRGRLSFRAVAKGEMEQKKDMSGEESMVLSHIQAAGNEGIWTKHIKAKTELHQTVIDRCLKSLTQKQLIKSIKSVKHPTRKLYMLYHLEPSVELTGGPWYTDNELDTEFIKLLSSACLRFIKDRSFPKTKHSSEPPHSQPIYPIGGAPSYPSTQQVVSFLSKSKITETQLTFEHVEMLLNVLILDGEIEKIPAFGAAMWEANSGVNDNDSDDEERSKKKKKRKSRDDDDVRRKRLRRAETSDSESGGDDSQSDSENERPRSKSRSRSKLKSKSSRKRKQESSESESETDSDERRRKRKSKKRRVQEGDSDASSDEDSTDGDRRKKSKSKSRHRDKSQRRGMGSSEDESDSDTDIDRRSKSGSKARSKSKSHKRSRSTSPERGGSTYPGFDHDAFGAAYVYRAIRSERLSLFATGLDQTPCGRCPVFDFCKEGGPVNPSGCVYYGEWLSRATVAAD